MSAIALPPSNEPARRARAAALAEAAAWLLAVAAATAAFIPFRGEIDKAYPALGYLLIVLGGSARRGRVMGVVLAVAAFLCYDFFLLPPYGTLIILDPLDWLVLFSFLVTGVVGATLLHRAQRQAEAARARAAEVNHLATLGAETLNAGRAEAGVHAIARVLLDRLELDRCEMHEVSDGASAGCLATVTKPAAQRPARRHQGLLAFVAEQGVVASERSDGSSHVQPERLGLVEALADASGARAILIPLLVRERVVGVLRLIGREAIDLDAPARRFVQALAYYAALGVERVRLVREAERAEALAEADRLKDALLASVSHDLRTPLTTIKAVAREIRDAGEERAGIVEEQADRLNHFVSDLLDLSRLNGGGIVASPELVPADELVASALRQVEGSAGEHPLRVTLPAGDDLPVGRFDLPLALRALVNLLENACKYSPPGSAVDVEVERHGPELEVRVADQGPGVPSAERGRIFDAFYRLPGHKGLPGTGLGLSIARRLAEAQGGTVRFAPRRGGGSIFTLVLPAANAIQPIPAEGD